MPWPTERPELGFSRAEILIRPVCDGVPLDPFTIPANSPAGTLTRTYDDPPAGASCTGSETPNGSTDTVFVTIAAGPLPVSVPPGASVTASVTDTYQDAVVSVTVEKTIAGAAAGQRARIVIRTRCGDQTLPDFVIPAGEGAGTQSRTYRGLTPGESCTVRELEDGGTDGIAVETSGDQEVTVPVIGTATAHLRDTFAATETETETETDPGQPGEPEAGAVATLPQTGAPDGVGTLVLLGAALIAAGALLLRISRTSGHRVGQHPRR